jgi:hypothetical protein
VLFISYMHGGQPERENCQLLGDLRRAAAIPLESRVGEALDQIKLAH